MYLQPLELEYLVVLQHARLVLSGTVLYLLHGQLDLARLQVGDENLRTALEFGQFLGQEARAKVLGRYRQLALAVAKGGLDNEVTQVGDFIDNFPQRIVRRGVAR